MVRSLGECKRCQVSLDTVKEMLEEPVDSPNFAQAATIINNCPVCRSELGHLLKRAVDERDRDEAYLELSLVSGWQRNAGLV